MTYVYAMSAADIMNGQLFTGFQLVPIWVPCGCSAVYNFTTMTSAVDDGCCQPDQAAPIATAQTTTPRTPLNDPRSQYTYLKMTGKLVIYFFSVCSSRLHTSV
jgi:hypothetical protein